MPEPAGASGVVDRGDERHPRARGGGGAGDGKTLFARRAVGDDAHRVDRLVGRPGGDQQVPAREGKRARRRFHH